MSSFDYRKELKALYVPKNTEPTIVAVPPMKYLMVDGAGDPNVSKDYQDAIGALYSVSYTIKMMPKRGIVPPGYVEYSVPPLEGLWWAPPGSMFSLDLPKSSYQWTAMIMQPPFVTAELVQDVIKELKVKKPNPALAKMRFEPLEEGKCGQALHIGPYSDEPATIDKLEKLITDSGLHFRGKHHEIYLSDPRRTAPEKLKTILRHPVA